MIGIENYKECSGIAELHAAPVLHIVGQSNLTSEEMACIILDNSCMSRSRFMTSKLNWEVLIPSKSSPTHEELIKYSRDQHSKGKCVNLLG